MFQIVIQNKSSETVIHNVFAEELPFWEALLADAVQGDIQIVPLPDELKHDQKKVA